MSNKGDRPIKKPRHIEIQAQPHSVNDYQAKRRVGKQSSGRGVTSQHDSRRIYKKSWMPRRRKQQWARFKKRVNAARFSNEGTRTVVYNDRIKEIAITPYSPIVPALQAWSTCCLYGWRGKKDGTFLPNGYSDIRDIAFRDSDIPYQGKVMFKSGVLDCTYVNNSEIQQLVEGNWVTKQQCVMELDIYEIYYYKDRHQYSDLDSALTEDTTDPIGSGAEPNISYVGVTPWDNTQAISNLGFKIMKKTKYFIGAGQAVTYQMRDAANHLFDKYEILDDSFPDQFVKRKVTKGLLAIGKAVPYILPDDASERIYSSFSAGYTRKYSYVNYQTDETKDKWLYVKGTSG